MATLKFFVSWCGERAAGINAGSEEITITARYSDCFTEDEVEAYRATVREMYDNAAVLTEQEQAREDDRERRKFPNPACFPRCLQCGALACDHGEGEAQPNHTFVE